MKHSVYGPSRLERIILCPGSVSLIEVTEKQLGRSLSEQSPYAERGDHLHEIVAGLLENPKNTAAYDELKAEDQNQILDCIDYQNMVMKKIGNSMFASGIESEISLAPWGLPEIWGTSDRFFIDYVKQHADILDWKFGSIFVDAKKNPQFLAYGAGAVSWPTSIQTITVHAVQPPLENYSTYTVTRDELFNWVHSVAAKAILDAQHPNPPFNPGVEQCRWCEGLPYCKPYLKYAQDAGAKAFSMWKNISITTSTEDIVNFLVEAPILAQAIKKLTGYLTAELMAGRDVPGMKLVQGRANRVWKDEAKTIKWLAENADIEEVFKAKLISPSQAETAHRGLAKDDRFKALIKKPPGKISLALESDPRPAFEVKAAAQEAFKNFVLTPEKTD